MPTGVYVRVLDPSKKGSMTGPKSPRWKGDLVGYSGAHQRMLKTFGKAKKCEACGSHSSDRAYEWANMTGKYHDPKDYKQMCHSCHMKHDVTPQRRRENSSNAAKKYWERKRAERS